MQMLIVLNMLATAMALTRPARTAAPMNLRENKQETQLSKGAIEPEMPNQDMKNQGKGKGSVVAEYQQN